MNTNTFATESFLLIPHTVTDLADFCARPEHYLVSVDREGKRAAALWFDRATRNPTEAMASSTCCITANS